MTAREFINQATRSLGAAGVESARLESEWLMAYVLQLPRLRLYLQPDRPLNAAEAEQFRELIARRARRIPTQYLVGSASFLGLEILVKPGVLIPRPETESLAQHAVRLLKATFDERISRGDTGNCYALDFGTGSGCLAVALAAECPFARIAGIDASPDALEVATQNIERNGLGSRVSLLSGRSFDALSQSAEWASRRFDLIVANPPYIPTADIPGLSPEVRDHEPLCALDGGPDGLVFFRELCHQGLQWLRPGGVLAAEFGDSQAATLSKLFSRDPWENIQIEKDLSGTDRILIVRVANRERGAGVDLQ